MSSLGVLFAVDAGVVEHLRRLPLEERPEYISEDLEELYFEDYPDRTCELDRSWDAMHRALSDGSLNVGGGSDPLSLAILGGEVLYFDEEHDDYIITLKTPAQAGEISAALAALTDEEFVRRYEAIPDEEYGEFKDPDDMDYTLEYLRDSVSFWDYAAKQGLWVLFTADR